MQRTKLASPDNTVTGTLIRPDLEEPRRLIGFIHGGGCNAGYFELGVPSPVDAALACGYGVLLVDRPAANAEPGGDPIALSIPLIEGFLEAAVAEYGLGSTVALVGHSIGGAIALTLAAAPRRWHLVAVAVSGIGDEPPNAVLAWRPGAASGERQPNAQNAALFLGAEGTYGWQALPRLRRASEPWVLEEAIEVIHRWPARWPELAPRIDMPVHLRLADGEKIWMTGETVVARMAACLTASPLIDAAVLPQGGHLYELHKRGPELIASQLAFFDRVFSRSPTLPYPPSSRNSCA